MSNALAIGAVTAVIQNILKNGLMRQNLSTILDGDPDITVLLPNFDGAGGGSSPDRLNLFLYQATLNTSWRNVGMPSRNSDGDLTNNPLLALDLHYLLTAHSAKAIHAEILLGFAMQILHDTPVLPRDRIRSILQSFTTDTNSALRSLTQSDLADQMEQVKITPMPMNIEEISKLWAAMQTQYRPTVAYHVSVVLIERSRSVKTALPVRERRLVALPYRGIVIREVQPQSLTAGSSLTLLGENFNAEQVEVLVRGEVVAPTLISDQEIQLNIPASLSAGMSTVQVKHLLDFGSPSGLHRGFESNVMPFVLRPLVTNVVVTTPLSGGRATIQVTVNPAIAPTQKVILLLNQVNPPTGTKSAGYSFEVAARSAAQSQITVPLTNVQPGRYLVRVQVDGAESWPEVDDKNFYSGEPSVTL
jgi:hypothetical protein